MIYNNYVIFVMYDGYNYKGFQIQQDFDTIQKRIYNALTDTFKYLNLNLKIISMSYTGRTDAKVSAIKQIVNFKTDKPIKINNEFTSEFFLDILNSFLPDDIKVYKFNPVKGSFNSRYEAISKTYIYKMISINNFIINKKYSILNILENEEYFKNERDYIKDKYGLHNFIFLPDFDDSKRQKLLNIIPYFNTEAHFDSFYKPDKVFKNTFIKLQLFVYFYSFADINLINLEFESRYFLRNMVRKIVGTILAYVYDEISLDYVKDMFLNPDPSKGKYISSPCGLILFDSNYTEFT